MSALKEVEIVAQGPFDFAENDEELAKMIGQLVSNPFQGLKFEVRRLDRFIKNERGGDTAQVQVSIDGIEAVHWSYLYQLIIRLKVAAMTVKIAQARYIEHPFATDWINLLTSAETAEKTGG